MFENLFGVYNVEAHRIQFFVADYLDFDLRRSLGFILADFGRKDVCLYG